jgi:subtilisin family serine protease
MNYGKLSLTLSSLIREYEVRGAQMNPAQPPRPQAFSIFPDKLQATVFIHCNENASFSGLPGIRMYSNTGTVRTALVDFQNSPTAFEGLDDLSEMESVHYISSSMRLKPLNDVAALKTGLTAFRASHSALTGEGVVIGIIDSGIDSSHPAFAGRIHSIWDQTIPAGDDATKPYGKVLKAAEMAESADESGHGTHIAGIAAGFDPQFGGVAAGADIVVVKTDFQTAHIADAIRHVFNVAEELGKPAVVNLSAGGQLDAHDGTDDLSKFIEQELKDKTGRLVVAAAGNEAAQQIHARVEAPALVEGQPVKAKEVLLNVPKVERAKRASQLILRGWYDSNGKCTVRLTIPSGSSANTEPVPNNIGSPSQINFTKHFPYPNMDSETYIAKTLIPCPLNDSHEFFIDTRRIPPLTFIETSEVSKWKLSIENEGAAPLTVDVWLWVPEGAKEPEFLPEFDDSLMKIGSPGCAGEAITVASYTTRADVQSPLEVDTISPFSSPGLLRNGNLKPDVAAPGAIIISARSSQTNPLLSNITGGFTVGSGTSAAAAFITGVCALLLQNNSALTPSAVKDWLRTNSRIPEQPAGQHDEKWGYGLLNLTNVGNLP